MEKRSGERGKVLKARIRTQIRKSTSPMSPLLAKAFEEASQLPEEAQDAVAELVISFIHPDEADEAEWDALVRSPESSASASASPRRSE